MEFFKRKTCCRNVLLLVLLISFAILCLLFPPFIRFSSRYNSDQIVPIEKVIGKWVQIEDVNSQREVDDLRSSFSTFVIFKENGEYFLKYKCGNSADNQEISGKWHYDSGPCYFLRFVPLGFRNWIKLDFGHGSLPQFYLKTDSVGNIYLNRCVVACISNKEFVKMNPRSNQ